MFIPYKDIDNDSNVSSYEIGLDYIAVQFANGSVYVYSYRRAGKYHVDRMKALAVSGDGLNSYIMRNCCLSNWNIPRRKFRNNWIS